MAYVPNYKVISTKNGLGQAVNMPLSVLAYHNTVPSMFRIRTKTGFGSIVYVVNASLIGRHYIPEPFAAAGIQSPEIWGTFDFGPAYLNYYYQEQWYIENIEQPVIFHLVEGSLPPGLELETIGSTAQGQISGIPTELGEFPFVLAAQGPTVTANRDFIIQVNEIQSYEVGGYIGGI